MHHASLLRAMSMSVAIGAMAGSGCFQPDLPAGQFKCDRPEDTCPTGMLCVSGLCQSRFDDPEAPSAVDMATPPVVTPAKGCTGTGMMLASVGGKDAHACSGSFPSPSGSAVSLCASGYHVCKSSDASLLFDARASGRCDQITLGGFFAADVLAGYDASGTLICNPKVAVATAALVGCGAETGARTVDPPCGELVVAAPCNGTVTGWGCTTGLSNASHAAGKLGGVLCCKD